MKFDLYDFDKTVFPVDSEKVSSALLGFFRLAEGVVHVHGNDAVDEIEVFAEFDGSAVVSFCDGVVGNAVNGNGILLKLVAASGKHNRGQHNQTNQNCYKFFVHNK